jgi:hypothetical protein
MFRTVPLSIIRSLFTVHSAVVYVIQVCRQLSSRTRMEYRGPARKLSTNLHDIYHCCMTYTIADCAVNKFLIWTEELSETCRVSCQNKFVNLVHLIGFIIKKFVTMHGHMNVKFEKLRSLFSLGSTQPPTQMSTGCISWG